MTIDLAPRPDAVGQRYDAARVAAELDAATANLDAPLGALHLGALRWNVADMLRRANGVPIRVASKSIRSRPVLEALLDVPGYAGVMAYTLPEALWLATTVDDVLVGYPTADRRAIRALSIDPELARRVTLMVDSVEQLDLVDAVLAPSRRERVQVCLELDAAWRRPGFGHVGVRRSPVRTPAQAGELAARIAERAGFRLVGVMAYEAQVAGVADGESGPTGAFLRWMREKSMAELRERRAAVVAAVERHADLRFVNGGGTGSLELTANDPAVTELAAGSGLFAGHYFDGYAGFMPAPASAFGLDVVRRPDAKHATLLGGGWIASGPAGEDRLPKPVKPEGLSLLPREGAGEVQTPVTGGDAASLHPGDRVWLRHAKSGELSEHLDAFHVVHGGRVVEVVSTYRGDGKVFL
ncbi:alanine racemase [Agromyces rhizosphaerae]|uniref:Alanine racemase n=1 Tax=Agromyces rhizosphaerae TaxID=88374 RepID=A0A9W6CZV8_9MICO|nr:alanine racemase [Agromyces rhizosphaerae]GLI28314.1 alanine racemase [Agromyces rhizosphaerae]